MSLKKRIKASLTSAVYQLGQQVGLVTNGRDAIDRIRTEGWEHDFRTRDAIVMGVAQAVALQPGVSRAGVTMSASRWLHFDRESAARLSFLMSIPIIAGAALYKAAEVVTGSGIPHGFVEPMVWGTLASAVSGFIAIAGLLRLLNRGSFTPLVIYRVALGIAVVTIFATGVR